MPKPLVNNKITYPNIHGRIIQHELYLNQGVQTGDSPTFANLQLSGDATIQGNLYVYGNTTILDTNITEFEDNIVLLNRLETGSGVTLNQSGFEIERGTLENYRFVFNESDDTFRVGPITTTQAVAVREDSPLINGFMIWNDLYKRIDSTNTFALDFIISNTANSLSSTTGSLVTYGGVGIKRDVHVDGKLYLTGSTFGNKSIIYTDTTTNTLTISSAGDIDIFPQNKVQIPFDKKLTFGTTEQSISANNITKNLTIDVSGNVIFDLETNKYISVPNQIPITFSTPNEKVYTDSSNNMVVESTQDVNLIPGPSKKVLVPVNNKLAFYTSTQFINANLNNDLLIGAGNQVYITPGTGLDVNLPTDSGIRLGGSGNQRIYSDNNNYLYINSSSDLFLTPSTGSKIIIPANIPLTFGSSTGSISSDTFGNMFYSASNAIVITNTRNAINSTTASMYLLGGLSVIRDIYTGGKLKIVTNSTEAITLSDASSNPVLTVDTINKTTTYNSSILINNSSANIFNIHDSFVVNDTANTLTSSYKTTFTNSTDTTSTTSSGIVNYGGLINHKKLDVLGAVTFNNGLNMNSTKITNVIDPTDPQDAATKSYVDLVKQGLYVKDSVIVATFTTGNLSTDFQNGSTVDSYILQTNDRILIKDQINPIENGIYTVNVSGLPTRSNDFDIGKEASGTFVFIQDGSINKSLGWICNSLPSADIIGTDSISFTQFTALGQVVAGSALSKTFNTIDVNVDNYSIEVFSDSLRIKNTGISTGLTGGSGAPLETTTDQSHVTKLGTVNTGTWEANTVSVVYGGTGRGVFTSGNILYGNGTSGIKTDSTLFFDDSSIRLGLGTNSPTSSLHIDSTGASSILLNAGQTFNPEIILSRNFTIGSIIGISQISNDYGSGVYPDSLVIKTTTNLQLVSNNESRFTLMSNGNIGINTSTPGYLLDVNGNVGITGITRIFDTTNSTNLSNAALVISGGISVNKDAIIAGKVHIVDTTMSTISNASLVVNGGLTINASENAVSLTSGGGITVLGGASINMDTFIGGDIYASKKLSIYSTNPATSLSSGGGITNLGGQSISKNLIVGGSVIISDTTSSSSTTSGSFIIGGGAGIAENINIGGSATITDFISYGSGGLFNTINNTSGSFLWTYCGQINNSTEAYTEIYISNGQAQPTTNVYSLRAVVSISGTSTTFNHSHIGTINLNLSKPELIVYNDTTDLFHLFIKSPPNSKLSINVVGKIGDTFQLRNELIGSEPSGVFSGYLNTWLNVYTTNKQSNLDLDLGNLVVEGNTFKTADNLPIVGFNNDTTTSTRNIGTLYQRYQTSNDSGTGDIVSDSYSIIDTLGSQLGATSTQIKLSNITNTTDNYYNDWWIKVTSGTNINQVRKIISYSGSLHVAEIDTPWTTQNPSASDNILLFSSTYIATYYDEINRRYNFAYSSYSSLNNKQLYQQDYCDIGVKNLYISDTTSSTFSTGGLISLGGITVRNTTNSTDYLQGGALSVYGGASIKENVHVGNKLHIGQVIENPQELLHINSTSGTVRLQNNNGGYSYIDFVETGSNNRFGILRDPGSISVTFNNTDVSPNSSNKLFTVISSGNIGIGTTSVNSLLTIRSNNVVTTDNDFGSLVIVGGTSSSSGSRSVFYGNSAGSNSGNLELYSGTTGSIKIYTSNLEQLQLDSSGILHLYSTQPTQSSTSGSFLLDGGVSIRCTENSVNVSNGGSLYTDGGASIQRDLFVGGDIFVSGNIVAGGSVSTPIITFSNTSNCTVSSYYNNNLVNVSAEGILTFAVEILPLVASENCQFEFSLPDRTNAFVNRGELVASCSGYSDDTNLIPLFNNICVGVTGSTRGLVKFQSISTSLHYFTVICRYTTA